VEVRRLLRERGCNRFGGIDNRLFVCEASRVSGKVATASRWWEAWLPSTSTFKTWSLSSLIPSSPLSRFSRVWSRSFLADVTIGMSVVRRSRRASSRPMPREAGVTRAQGCMLLVYKSWSVHDHRHRNTVKEFGSRADGMESRNDDIVGVDRREIEFARMRDPRWRVQNFLKHPVDFVAALRETSLTMHLHVHICILIPEDSSHCTINEHAVMSNLCPRNSECVYSPRSPRPSWPQNESP
jgi:hypothetical protein